MRQIVQERYVNCPFSAVVEHAGAALDSTPEMHVTPNAPLGEEVRITARQVDDITDAARKHDALAIAWRPAHRTIFPQFAGALTVRPAGRGARMRITGSYEAPFGAAGKVFDALVGRAIAKATLAHFLRKVAESVEERWRFERIYSTLTKGTP